MAKDVKAIYPLDRENDWSSGWVGKRRFDDE